MDIQGTFVLKPRRLEDIGRPGFRLKRPIVVLLSKRAGQVIAMVSTPLIEAVSHDVEPALEALKDRIVQAYAEWEAKGPKRTEEESEMFETMSLWLER
ncbi:MAG: hypothetical protein AAB215_08040 [Planctomycetota bacterium]